jgi:hypothetical protein
MPIYAPPDQRHEPTLGRTARKGMPLPKLKTVPGHPKTVWQRITASSWYGRQTDGHLDIMTGTGLWYRRGLHQDQFAGCSRTDCRREPQVFMSTHSNQEPSQIIAHFVRRWQIEVTFAETRAHLGVEPQRQWSGKPILRTTPSLLALYSLVTMWAGDVIGQTTRPCSAAWYKENRSYI